MKKVTYSLFFCLAMLGLLSLVLHPIKWREDEAVVVSKSWVSKYSQGQTDKEPQEDMGYLFFARFKVAETGDEFSGLMDGRDWRPLSVGHTYMITRNLFGSIIRVEGAQ